MHFFRRNAYSNPLIVSMAIIALTISIIVATMFNIVATIINIIFARIGAVEIILPKHYFTITFLPLMM